MSRDPNRTLARFRMELMPVTDRSADCSNSAVSAENVDSEVGETQRAQEPTEGIAEEAEKTAGLVSQWKWKDIFTAVILWFGYLSVNIAYSTIEAFFPNVAAERGATPFITGVIISCAPLCVVILAPFVGYFLPQLGLRFALLSGLWLVGGAYILMSFVASMPSGWVFIMFSILLRLTEGTGSAMFVTSVLTLIPGLFPDSAGTVSGLMEVACGFGYAIGPPIGGVLFTAGGFRLPFLVVGATCLVFLPLIILLVPNSECEKQVISLKTVVKLLTKFIIFLLVTASTLSIASLAFFSPIFQPFLSEQFHLDEKHVGLVLFLAPIIYLTVALLVGKLADKCGPRWLTIVGLLTIGVALFFIGPADFIAQPKLWITVVAFGFIGFGAALGIVPIYLDMLTIAKSMENEDYDTVIGIVSGITASTLSLGEFIGPLIGGALRAGMDFQTSAMVFGEVFLAEGALLLGATLIDRRCVTSWDLPTLSGSASTTHTH